MPPPPDLESLRLLVLVARHGSLSAAATEAGISQPAASRRLSALERRLQVVLLERTRRGSVLTPAGVLVTGWAERVVTDLEALLEGAAALRAQTSARLAIGASQTVAEHLVPRWLGDLRRADPRLHVGLEVTNSRRVCDLTRERAVDVGFIESPGPVPGLTAHVVARDRLVLVVAPTHPWARRRDPVTIRELAETPLISREEGSGTRETTDHELWAHDLRPAPPLLELGSSSAVRSAVLAGGGPALLSELVVEADLATGALVEVATDGIDLSRALRAVWPVGARPGGAAGALVARALATS